MLKISVLWLFVFVLISVSSHSQTLRLKAGNAAAWLSVMGEPPAPLSMSLQDWVHKRETWIKYAENNGYPFASVQLDSLHGDSLNLEAILNFQSGNYIIFDTLAVDGNLLINKQFLAAWLHIPEGQPFSQQQVTDAAKRATRLPYAQLSAAPSVIFSRDKALIKWPLRKVASNSADGVVGFLPNEEQAGRLTLTGQFNLKLNNLFSRGKMLQADWQRMRRATQKLNILYVNPLGWKKAPLELQMQFDLLKEDSSFLNRNIAAAVKYSLNAEQKIGFSLKSSNSSAQRKNSSALPESPMVTSRFVSYGMLYELIRTDNYWYPHKGWRLQIEAAAGNKKLKSDTLPEAGLQITARFLAEKYFALSAKTVWLWRANAGLIESKYLFLNELNRVGGLQTLRGFNENRFYASSFGVLGTEYRFFWEENSFLFAFYEQGSITYKAMNTPSRQEFPLGIGVGISFATQGGIFNLTYALGHTAAEPMSVNNAKIHFGYVGRF